ncbi:kinase [Coralloluteibacterium stylophorae]|uniref:Kinase n=1 Tax=Coralloluteibacterium stylophorae TaxID=1776034 RepID=A0A8J8AX39_9GAMM|nr:kinase [Coralloluteibacterium stylophorae]MBS7456410.1 kinase [Coralloluteibacterium stylophorae]
MRPSPSPPSAGWPADLVAGVLDEALAVPATTPVFGITGLQGSGKTTLARQLVALAQARGLRVATFSIDDVYLDRPRRLALARTVHPLLATRGPPGTHDLELALETLARLREWSPGRSVRLPSFDKLGDRRRPLAEWPEIRERPDLVVFEGWFLKTPPESPRALAAPVNALERDEDPDGSWRGWCNARLAGYAPLWRGIDRLLFLAAPGFEHVPRWRLEQERALQAAQPGRAGMDQAQILRFVQHYERVSRQALRTLPGIAERTLRLDACRRPA